MTYAQENINCAAAKIAEITNDRQILQQLKKIKESGQGVEADRPQRCAQDGALTDEGTKVPSNQQHRKPSGLTRDEQRLALWKAIGVIQHGCMYDSKLILANLHAAGFVVARADSVAAQAQPEPLVRYCPGCGSIGAVETKYRDCCPDGSEARLIPQALAEKCRDTFKVAITSMLAEQNQQPVSGADELPIELRGVAEEVDNSKGFWRSCSGCHELNEGHSTGPYSKTLKCALGNGCAECGGIGAIWDTTDYDAMADHMANPGPSGGAVESRPSTWLSALRISELQRVDEALSNFANDSTGDNGVSLVQAVLDAKPRPSGNPSGVTLYEGRARRIYVAGPMTGLEQLNFPAFNAAAKMLRDKGWHVENPADHGEVPGAEWADYLAYDLTRIGTCGAIYLLPGWEKSKGAQFEVSVALALGMDIVLANGAAYVGGKDRFKVASDSRPPPTITNPLKVQSLENIEPLPSRQDAIHQVVGKCNLIPGATHWNAAEFMYDMLAEHAQAFRNPEQLNLEAAAILLTEFMGPAWEDLPEQARQFALIRAKRIVNAAMTGQEHKK